MTSLCVEVGHVPPRVADMQICRAIDFINSLRKNPGIRLLEGREKRSKWITAIQ